MSAITEECVKILDENAFYYGPQKHHIHHFKHLFKYGGKKVKLIASFNHFNFYILSQIISKFCCYIFKIYVLPLSINI